MALHLLSHKTEEPIEKTACFVEANDQVVMEQLNSGEIRTFSLPLPEKPDVNRDHLISYLEI
ncbi:MAG: hypothetical protein MRZ79_11070 [Bacteroidia bacterium]|nr:hypothetical protein [Bacteroidia bacterium]